MKKQRLIFLNALEKMLKVLFLVQFGDYFMRGNKSLLHNEMTG